MTPERWKAIDELAQAALDHPPAKRAAFLVLACAGDEALQREVESLILYQSQASEFLEQPALERAAAVIVRQPQRLIKGDSIGHYQVVGLLGEGGMGEVYLARDRKLGRHVALKLLPEDFMEDSRRLLRFKQEACAASALNHPNIVTIYEIGESSGRHYIATELIEGKTLRDRMRDGPMTIEEVLDVATQVASALAAAHETEIVHRDIKPENIMVRHDGLVKVLDFGLAKLTKQPATDAEATTMVKTSPGVVMGTIPYMSPEHALGRAVDHRSDVFSVGVLLYEMASGRSPFVGANASETLDRILHSQPEAISHFNSHVPAELERVVQKCLEKDRERRYQTTRDLAIDLGNLRREWETGQSGRPRREQTALSGIAAEISRPVTRYGILRSWWALSLAAVVLLVIAGLGYRWLMRENPVGARPEIKSLAVLPLENLSGDQAQEYFADGMTEALINNMARIRALKVSSRNSVMRYKRSNKSLSEIARELNVDAVITGSVQRSGEHVRVTAQLIHAATDTHLWARDYERDLTDVLKLEGEVTRAIANEIHIQVTAEESARLASARSVDPQAHEAYLLGRYHLGKENLQDWERAIEHFQRAIGFAPDYAEAYAGLSDSLLQQATFAVKPSKEVVPPARDAALKAIELDEQLAEAHTALGNVKYYYDWDWAGAEKEFKRALELNPASLIVHIAYGHLLSSLGRRDEAVREGQLAVQLDPSSAEAHTALGRFLYRARRYEEALPVLQRAVQLEPRSIGANTRLGSVYTQLGRYTEAIAVY
ncbi:MAG TPA: protein kinase, partial [Pyrinomonadaceae bacterium]|nr:protein kinase [Pyrinomonadaceae bacterium]